jgi:hypothetical protein
VPRDLHLDPVSRRIGHVLARQALDPDQPFRPKVADPLGLQGLARSLCVLMSRTAVAGQAPSPRGAAGTIAAGLGVSQT